MLKNGQDARNNSKFDKEAAMTASWDEPTVDEETEDDDPGFVGGGGVAETAEGDDDDQLDEHGDNLARADDDEV